jgi:hypothetical protein
MLPGIVISTICIIIGTLIAELDPISGLILIVVGGVAGIAMAIIES